jgi:hypothetical protein
MRGMASFEVWWSIKMDRRVYKFIHTFLLWRLLSKDVGMIGVTMIQEARISWKRWRKIRSYEGISLRHQSRRKDSVQANAQNTAKHCGEQHPTS